MNDYDSTPAPVSIMEMSAEIGEIAKALPKAQAAMGDVFKNANNPAFRSKYADLAAVIEAVLPALNKAGISLLQPVSFDGTSVMVGTMLLHESGQWVRCTLGLPISKRDAHGIGSAITYGKRYGLQSMSGVAPEDDDGNAASEKGAGKAAEAPKKDYGPGPMGDDFPGAEGRGKTAHAAKKDGTSERFIAIKKELEALTTMSEVGAWTHAYKDEIATWPEAWRKSLRESLDEQKRAIEANTETDQP